MTAHKHAEMIKAKADNMELVVFFKADEVDWRKADSQNVFPTSNSPHVKYFLCHPKHAEACLHWLNGGEMQSVFNNQWADTSFNARWSPIHPFMREEEKIRIKPRKEKRWIGVTKGGGATRHYKNKELLIQNIHTDSVPDGTYQLIEIEVEV